MKILKRDAPATSLGEPTLANLLRSTAHTRLPERFYWLLQTAAPWALQFWALGWHRTAGWLGVVSVYGLWAIAEQRLEGSFATDSAEPVPLRRPGLWRALRRGTAFFGAVGAIVLLLEAFLRVMSVASNCLGCAG